MRTRLTIKFYFANFLNKYEEANEKTVEGSAQPKGTQIRLISGDS